MTQHASVRQTVAFIMLGLMAITTITGNPQVAQAKSASVIVTKQMRQNAIRNVERYEWAGKLRDRLEKKVEPYMALSDERLWQLPVSQQMPRDSAVNRDRQVGCPNCGAEHYEADYHPSRWHVEVLDHPWQVQCRNCGTWLPSNDLEGYYKSALDKQGRFQRGEGDSKFLKPMPERVEAAKKKVDGEAAFGDPSQWIDDGAGVKVGEHHWWVGAFYNYWRWTEILNVTETMATLYTLTGEQKYAHKAGVLLDRIADIYPEMNYAPFYKMGMECSTGGSGIGRIQGKIWETFTAQKLSRAYDYIYDALIEDQALAEFSARMAREHEIDTDKSSTQAIATHIEEHLLLEFVKGIKDRRIHGNPGFQQHAMAATAIALDRPDQTPQLLEWLFKPSNQQWSKKPIGGQIPSILQQTLGREGLSDEVGIGYASIPVESFTAVADLLRQYKRYTKRDLYRDYPKFRNGFTSAANVIIAEYYTPNWGDGNKCMNSVGSNSRHIPTQKLLSAYRAYHDPAIAREIYHANGESFDGLVGSIGWSRRRANVLSAIYDKDPEAIVERLKNDLPDTDQPFESYNAGGYGLAVVQAPAREPDSSRRGLALYYGRTQGHGHPDRLAINGLAHDVNILPDMGYPTYTGLNPKRTGWTDHTISHNTLMVNDRKQDANASWSGKTKLFASEGPVHVADVDGDPGVYPEANLQTYRRCLVMVDVDDQNSYALDLFWVRGGKRHRLIQNGPGPRVTTSGLDLTDQDGGTYAGPEVSYGEFYDGQVSHTYRGSGFQYLKDVSKGAVDSPFWVDWKAVEPRREMPEDWQAHLRVHNLGQVDELALTTGIPPAYKGNPKELRYTLRTRSGDDLNSQFVSVLEPYGDQPFIDSTELVGQMGTERGEDFAAVVRVKLTDGREDLIMVRETPGGLVSNGVTMEGRVGLVRYAQDDEVAKQVLIGGSQLDAGNNTLTQDHARLEGTLAGFDDSDPTDIRLNLAQALAQTDDLVGRYIVVDNDARSDASYQIQKVYDDHTLGIGSSSLVERFVDPLDYSKGLIHTVSEGDRFTIALSTSQ